MRAWDDDEIASAMMGSLEGVPPGSLNAYFSVGAHGARSTACAFAPDQSCQLTARLSLQLEAHGRQSCAKAVKTFAITGKTQVIPHGCFGVMAFTIDVHHHILPGLFFEATNETQNPVGGVAPAPWSKESALSYMDEAEIDVSIVSISTPGVHVGNDAAAGDLARRMNELAAQLVQERSDRFGAFAALPLPDLDGSLRALEYGLDVLMLDGVVLFSNARGIYLGDPRLAPLFDELERREATVFVHPNASEPASSRTLGLPDTLIDFTADTTRVVAQLHYLNVFARTPSVKYIFPHGGGTIPYLATRFGIIDKMEVIPGGEARGTAADMLRRLYWDTASAWRPAVLHMLRSEAGIGQVLFGTDFPYVRRDLAIACRHDIETSPELGSEEVHAVLADNGLKLFPRFATQAAEKSSNPRPA